MPRLHYGNFHCEHEWADPHFRPKPALVRLNAELSAAFLGLAADGDAIWVDQPLEEGFASRLADEGLPRVSFVSDEGEAASLSDAFVPWGWTPSVIELARRYGLKADPPLIESVQRVNRRSFGVEAEREFGCGIDARFGPSAEEVERVVSASTGRWILKAEYGMSGRERFSGDAAVDAERAVAWARPRIARDGGVVWEPWLEIECEAGAQYDIEADGAVRVGVVPLIVDSSGRYRGSWFPDESTDPAWREALNVTDRAAARVAGEGYVGPLGIDVCRYRDGGGTRMRPLQDLNARQTMGRVTLGFARRLGGRGAWLHVDWSRRGGRPWCDAVRQRLPAGVRLVRTSPFEIGGSPVRHGTLLLLGEDREAIERMIATFDEFGV